MNYIYHITLNSGHVRHQTRADIGEQAIDALSETLDGILQGARLPVPGFDNYLINGSHHGYDLIATIWRGPWESRAPILTTATALKSRSAPALWRLMHDQATTPLVTTRDNPPRAPWLADRLEIGALVNRDAMSWTGDFSRCIAWAWHNYRKSDRRKD